MLDHLIRDYHFPLYPVDLIPIIAHNRSMKTLILLAALIPITLCDSVVKYCPRPKVVIPEIKIDLKEQKCLATMVYGEARGETERGMVAVAYTAVNRAVKKRICQVVLAPKQYSIFNNNPALRSAAMSLKIEPTQKNIIDNAGWAQAMKVSESVLKHQVPDPTHGSTHYLAPIVMKAKKYHYPQWSKQYRLAVVIDHHHFYKQKAKV